MKSSVKFILFLIALVIVVGFFDAIPIHNAILSQLWSLNQLHYFTFKEKLKARAFPTIDKRFTFTTHDSLSPEPIPSIQGGFYSSPVIVTLTSKQRDIAIYYTLDGSIPTRRSHYYQNPIPIGKTTVLRFRSFQSGYLPSETITHTYFINDTSQLPVLSLVTDPVNLWNKYSGIYANPKKRGKKWERNAYVEYFADKNSSVLRFPVELRIHGGWSRKLDKKHFRLRYSPVSVEGLVVDNIYNILTAEGTESERTVILRAAGGYIVRALREELFNTLYSEIGGFISTSTPVILYLNGDIWGIYYIHNRIDAEYLQRRFGEGSYDLLDQSLGRDRRLPSLAIVGDYNHWEKTLEFFKTHDMSQEEHFQRSSELIDIDNTTDYWLFNVYASNWDWPHNNLFLFRKRDSQHSQWRWISWDTDVTFDTELLEHNTLFWAIRSQLRHDLKPGKHGLDSKEALMSTFIVRSLLQNEPFRQKFINRFCDLLNLNFLPERVEAKLDTVIRVIAYDLPKDLKKWLISNERFGEGVQNIRNFIYKRPEIMRNYLQKEFQLGEIFTIELFTDPPRAGEIRINTIRPENYPWADRYFENAFILLTAKPSKDFEFVGWTEPLLGKDSQVRFALNQDIRVGAIFQRKR
jgi:hypothetical protein